MFTVGSVLCRRFMFDYREELMKRIKRWKDAMKLKGSGYDEGYML